MTESKKTNRFFWYAILVSAFLFKLGLLYYTYLHKHYLVPPGYDAIPHFQQIQNIIQTGSLKLATYPPIFHLLVVAISRVFHLEVWSILVYGTPVLMFLPSFAMFFLLRQIFSLKISVLVTSILLIASSYPTYAFVDGNYPDMLAYGFFAMMLFAFLIRYLKTKNYINLIWSGLFLLLIALTHHFTFFNILGILTIFGILSFYIFLWRSSLQSGRKAFLTVLSALFILAVGYLFASQFYGGLAERFIVDLFKQSSSIGNSYWAIAPKFSDYPDFVGPLVWYLGLAGLVFLLVISHKQKKDNQIKQLVIVWLLFFYILSRFGAVGIPGRFAREMALPLIVLIGYLLEYLIEKNPMQTRLGQILGFGLIGYLILINSALYTGLGKIPDGFESLIWYWPVDQQKSDFLQANIPQGTKILYNFNSNLYLPVKTDSTLVALNLTTDQVLIARQYLDIPQDANVLKKYNQMISDLAQNHRDVNFIFDDVKPVGDTNEVVYYHYAGYRENKVVLESLAKNWTTTKSFADSATLYEKN